MSKLSNTKHTIPVILLCAAGIAAGAQALVAQQRPAPNPPQGPLQRSEEIIYFKRMADSGPKRGQEIYFYKCWVCHNAYTRAEGSPAPTLKDLVKRPIMLSGKPMTDENIADKIREGGPGMPGYKYSLSDQDLRDLVGFFREGLCCWEDKEEHEPPLNPRFRAPRTPPRGE
jgi:mono/diheme cytochrome c family protein